MASLANGVERSVHVIGSEGAAGAPAVSHAPAAPASAPACPPAATLPPAARLPPAPPLPPLPAGSSVFEAEQAAASCKDAALAIVRARAGTTRSRRSMPPCARSAAGEQERSRARVDVERLGGVQLAPRPAPRIQSARRALVFRLVGAQTREHQKWVCSASASDAPGVG